MSVMRHSREFLAEVMERPAIAALVKQTLREIALHPNECIVVGQKSNVQFRVGGGKRSWVSMRVLVWMEAVSPHTDLEPPHFATPSCGTAGCINPAHQFARDAAPRIKVTRHVHATS